MPEDPYARSFQQAQPALQQQLTGRPDPGLQRAQSAAVRAPFAAGLQAATRGVGAGAGSNIRQQFMANQAAAVAQSRARAYEGAAQGKRSALQAIVGQRPGDLERIMRFKLHQAGIPGKGQAAAGAAAGGLSDMAKLAMLMQLMGGKGGQQGG
ncbi:MAG: hypothetical protein GY700_06395 [Propionibacteriaceae bacterium]|nr:hypothetical protein [Propionibacteriaceae bacterium]